MLKEAYYMIPLNTIKESEWEAIDYYRRHYFPLDDEKQHLGQPAISIQEALKPWAQAKERLFNGLGQQLIVSKDVDIDGYDATADLLWKEYNESGDFSNFIDNLTLGYTKIVTNHPNTTSLVMSLDALFDFLAQGSYYGREFEEISSDGLFRFTAKKGMRMVKLLSKIVDLYCHEVGLETQRAEIIKYNFKYFLDDYAPICTNRRIKGKLCISIHPLDFLTMSDNRANWSSCVSIKRQGDHRMGCIEMMNAPNIVVAYVASPSSNYQAGPAAWNNKTWRELIVVDERLLVNIKSYPFRQDDLTSIALGMIAELFNKNLGTNYQNSKELLNDNLLQDVSFPMTIMYNDFYTDNTAHQAWWNGIKPTEKEIEIPVIGLVECLWCGKEIEYVHYSTTHNEDNHMICESCLGIVICDECGDSIYADQAIKIDNSIYCEHCASSLIDI